CILRAQDEKGHQLVSLLTELFHPSCARIEEMARASYTLGIGNAAYDIAQQLQTFIKEGM
ncbi:UDP-N-acetylglucosamine--N-acetylmuramyl-(pentapeptide) pyrophosphoryl-undecaprenol N-acetylglucosamine transferase, partial [Treponema pallidum]